MMGIFLFKTCTKTIKFHKIYKKILHWKLLATVKLSHLKIIYRQDHR